MNVKALLEDDDAVSPVIGVILMVAITVILAAVIGSFVLGLGDIINPAPPSASFTYEFNDGGDGNFGSTDGNDWVNITHDGGRDINVGQVNGTLGDETIIGINGTAWGDEGSIDTGDTLSINETGEWRLGEANATNGYAAVEDITEGETLLLTWTAPGGSSSQKLAESTIG